MKPTMKGTARATTAEADRWRYGERHRRVVGPDGQEHFETVPLRPEDLLFPEEGDRLVSTKGHTRDCTYLEEVLEQKAGSKPGTLVLRDHHVDFGVKGIKPLLPDVAVFDGVQDWTSVAGSSPSR